MWPTWKIVLVCAECGGELDVGRPGGQDLGYARTAAERLGWSQNAQGQDVCFRHVLATVNLPKRRGPRP